MKHARRRYRGLKYFSTAVATSIVLVLVPASLSRLSTPHVGGNRVTTSTTSKVVTTVAPPSVTLANALTAVLAARTDDVQIDVIDRRSGQRLSLGGNGTEMPASMFKVFIAEEVLSLAKPLSLRATLPYVVTPNTLPPAPTSTSTTTSTTIATTTSTTSTTLAPAQLLTVQELLTRMIEVSDNDAATSLWLAGGNDRGAEAFAQRLGLVASGPSHCRSCPYYPFPGWGIFPTNAADQMVVLQNVTEPSRVVSAENQKLILSLMRHVSPWQNWGVGTVPGHAPAIAVKNGWYPEVSTQWQINSMGWVQGGGRDYLAVIMTSENPTRQYGIATVNALSSVLWNMLGPKDS